MQLPARTGQTKTPPTAATTPKWLEASSLGSPAGFSAGTRNEPRRSASDSVARRCDLRTVAPRQGECRANWGIGGKISEAMRRNYYGSISDSLSRIYSIEVPTAIWKRKRPTSRNPKYRSWLDLTILIDWAAFREPVASAGGRWIEDLAPRMRPGRLQAQSVVWSGPSKVPPAADFHIRITPRRCVNLAR